MEPVMFMLRKNSLDGRWNRTIVERDPDQSTTDCATIQPDDGLFLFIHNLSASADTTILPPCEIKRPRLLLVFQ